MRLLTATLATAACLIAATPTLADPCKANVRGYAAGATVAGQVRYVGDGDSLCIGPGSDPKTWTEIRLANFYAPELNEPGGRRAKADLSRLVAGRQLVCRATNGTGRQTYSYDRLIATCALNGVELGDLLRAFGGAEGGRGVDRRPSGEDH